MSLYKHDLDSISAIVNGALKPLIASVTALTGKIDQMAKTQADLDTALAGLNTLVQTEVASINAAIASLQAKINALPNPADFQPEIDTITAITNNLGQVNIPASATGTTPVPAPTPTTTP